MPGPRSLEIGRIQENTGAFGAVPGSTWSILMADEYTVEPENVVVNQEKFTGSNETTNQDVERQDLRGSLTMQIWPENAALANSLAGINTSVGNGSSRNADGTMREYGIEWNDKASGEFLQHLGLSADSVRIEIRPNESLRYVYDLVGQLENTTADFGALTPITILPYKMSHAHSVGEPAADTGPGMLVVESSTTSPPSALPAAGTGDGLQEPNLIEATIEIRNNLAPSEPRNISGQILWIDTGMRSITFTARIRVNSDQASNYRDAVRLRKVAYSWAFIFNYPGTGSPQDTLTLRMDRMAIVRAQRTGGVAESQILDCQWEVAKPTANDGIIYAVA